MIQLYDLLQNIKEKPGMYLGSASVTDLFIFLCGYKCACREMGLPLSEQEKEFREFQPWLQEKFKISTSASWAKIIMLYSTNESYGLELFFKLLAEFLHRQNSADVEEFAEEKQSTLV